MSAIVVEGGKKLQGEIDLQGAKNSALPILAATVLCHKECILHNCPNLSDVQAAVSILKHLGAKVHRQEKSLVVDASSINCFSIPNSLMREMRSSIVFLGAVAARTGSAVLSSPGGCELGPRPIDLHLAALRELGLEIQEENGQLVCRGGRKLKGNTITLSFPSVGTTENVILAAVTASGTTRLHNPAREPEIQDLCNFLNACGAKIFGAGTDFITITGVPKLGGAEHTVIPDRIVTATYLAAAAITGSELTLKGAALEHLQPVLSVLKNAGCELKMLKNSLAVTAPKKLVRVPTIRTLPYPGFPTDAGPFMIAMLSVAKGSSMFVENIFENRYRFTDELRRFGADVRTQGRVAVISGVPQLSATVAECTDLRGGAAVLLAALAADGRSEILKTEHINRGYEDICSILQSVGAQVFEQNEKTDLKKAGK